MSWFKVDDRFRSHRKVLSIPRRWRLTAEGLWTSAGTWAAGNVSDGWVPPNLPEDDGAAKNLPGLLVAAGLWHAPGSECDHPIESCPGAPEQGWTFHDWFDYQPSAEDLEQDKAAARERMAKARQGKRKPPLAQVRSIDVRANRPRTSGEVREQFPTSSDDVRVTPSPSPVPEGDRGLQLVCRLTQPDARATTTDDDDKLIARWQEIAAPGVDLAVEARAFLDRNGRPGADPLNDPVAAFEGWLRRTHDRQARPATGTSAAAHVAPPSPTYTAPPFVALDTSDHAPEFPADRFEQFRKAKPA